MTSISAVIITLNEERNIERCLQSLIEITDEIVVVDSLSSDRTEEICKNFDVQFISRKWEGYASTKNFANAQVKSDYILSIDADEAVSPELKKSILIHKENLQGAYGFNRMTNYAGKWVRHCGWYPDAKIRLFPTGKARWEGDFVHETLLIDHTIQVSYLKGDLHHYSYVDKHDHLLRIEKYSTLHAQKMHAQGRKANWFKILFSPIAKFLNDYLIKVGFLDGKTGFTICMLSAKAVKLKYLKLKKMSRG